MKLIEPITISKSDETTIFGGIKLDTEFLNEFKAVYKIAKKIPGYKINLGAKIHKTLAQYLKEMQLLIEEHEERQIQEAKEAALAKQTSGPEQTNEINESTLDLIKKFQPDDQGHKKNDVDKGGSTDE